ncbi:MAG: TolC family protein [Elusimicrobia bacterium]|nr:TolC family protein [Elusimicrobiota bacterium]
MHRNQKVNEENPDSMVGDSQPFSNGAKAWTIEDCLAHAMENNPSVRSARNGLKIASGNNLMALSEFMPRVSWSTVYIRNDKTMLGSLTSMPGFDLSILSPAIYSNEYYASSLSADLTLFSWRMKPLRNTMKANSKLARLKLASAENDLTLNVKKAFYTALYAKQLLIIAKTAENVARENLETSESLYKVGRVSSFDVSRARVNRINAKTEVISAKNFETVSIEGLRMVLSLPAGEEMDIKGEFPQDARDTSLENEISAALKRRPELNIAKEAEALQVSSKELARAGFLPTVFAGFAYSWEGLDLTADMDKYYTSWTAKAGILIPIFDGLFSIGRFRAQKAGLEQAREQVQGASDGVIMEVRQSYYSLVNARESLQAQKENVETAAENLKIAQERYKTGLLSLLELKDAELSLIGASTQRIKVLYDYNISMTSLDRAVGLPSDGERP